MKKLFTYFQGNCERKCKICFSGLSATQQDKMIHQIEEMGGEIVNELTKKTSFLIASKINTEKVIVSTFLYIMIN